MQSCQGDRERGPQRDSRTPPQLDLALAFTSCSFRNSRQRLYCPALAGSGSSWCFSQKQLPIHCTLLGKVSLLRVHQFVSTLRIDILPFDGFLKPAEPGVDLVFADRSRDRLEEYGRVNLVE